MNLLFKLIVLCVASLDRCAYSSFDNYDGYHSIFVHINNIAKGSDLNVIKSPIEYGKLTRMLSNVTDLRTISCYHFSNIRSEVHESNVTAVPPTESTSKSLSPTVSDRCLTGVSSVVQAVAQQKIWAFKSKLFCGAFSNIYALKCM